MRGMIGRSLNELSNPPRRKFDKLRTGMLAGRRRLSQGAALASRFARSALPQACALCADHSGDAILCAPCMNALPALPAACPSCASPSPAGGVCGACLVRPPRFAATIAAARYAFPLDRLVQGLKYEHRLAFAHPLGDALAAAVLRTLPHRPMTDAIVALPLAPARQRERGFNQAMEIARIVARRTGRPIASGLVRTSAGRPQASLPWSERRRNVRGAFGCNVAFTGRSIALVDDVMTTGATLDAAARALLAAGASRVEAWVVARTLAPGER
jgi:ComF family protein